MKIRPPAVGYAILFILYVFVCNTSASQGDLNLELTIKETAGVGIEGFPVQVVVPLPYGVYQDTDAFHLVDAEGASIPAQFNVLNRWWGKDGSIRHIQVLFQSTLLHFSGPGTGIATCYLRDDNGGPAMMDGISISDNGSLITVSTGVLRFTVRKTGGFDIIHEAWLDSDGDGFFRESEQVIFANESGGGMLMPRMENSTGTQYDAHRNDYTVTVEEDGPMRAIIRAEALTKYQSTTDHTHGWAVRIYAYKDKPYIKVDYQLQNSAKNVQYAWPLYFESMDVDFDLGFSESAMVTIGKEDGGIFQRPLETGISLRQERHDRFGIYDEESGTLLESGSRCSGYIDISEGSRGVMAATRFFRETWPNGFFVDSEGDFSINLFPWWSAQLYDHSISPTGLYWLEDMQHTVKEMLFLFHDGSISNQEKDRLARTFTRHPVVVVPTPWWYETHCTLDMDGLLPFADSILESDERIPEYPDTYYDMENSHYQFNWDNFMYVERKMATSQTGEWPTSVADFMITGDPADYFFAEQFALGELNVRPQWMAGYTYAEDQSLLRLTDNPYAGGHWRYHAGHGTLPLDAPYLDQTGKDANSRDDEHAWFYHVEESYYFTGNPWVKDWYHFVKEFRKVRLNQEDPFPDMSSRAIGHTLHHALQAYRITGDREILDLFHTYITTHVRGSISRLTGAKESHESGEAIFQTGFLARPLITYLNEIDDRKAWSDVFNVLSGFMSWNLHYGNFSYYTGINGEVGESSGTGLTFVDPQMWYYLNTGQEAYLTQLNEYLTTGINGGSPPYGNFTTWEGQFENRHHLYYLNHPRSDTKAPDAITDLTAFIEGDQIRLSWQVPEGTAAYHIVWSDRPISETITMNPEMTNWWAAETVGIELVEPAGAVQEITLSPDKTIPFYAAIFVFDAAGNMSLMSNCAESEFEVPDTTPPTIPQNLTAISNSADEVELYWEKSTDDTFMDGYLIFRDGVEVARTDTNHHTDTGLLATTPYQYHVAAVDYFGNRSDLSTEVSITTSDRYCYTLVDFGPTAEKNSFGLDGWNIVFMDQYTENVNLGPGGTQTVVGNNYAYNYQGIGASMSRSFTEDEIIRIRWYNAVDEPITFAPRISFTDPDRPISGESGIWYDLDEITVPGHRESESWFLFDATTTGEYFLVNVNSNTSHTHEIVCNAIQLIAGGSEDPDDDMDLNGDGVVDIRDIMMAIDTILEGTGGADINGDGVTNIQDVMVLVTAILDNGA